MERMIRLLLATHNEITNMVTFISKTPVTDLFIKYIHKQHPLKVKVFSRSVRVLHLNQKY